MATTIAENTQKIKNNQMATTIAENTQKIKKILCLIDGLGSGGAQRQIIGLAGFLKRHKYETYLAYYNPPNFYTKDIHRYGINLIELHPKNNMFAKFITVGKLIQKGDYDVVIAYIQGPGVIACLTKLFTRKKFQLIVSERSVMRPTTLKRKLQFYIYSLADYIVSNSYAQSDIIKKHFSFLKRKSLTIPNFVDLDYFCPIPSKQNPTDNKVLNILIIGRFIPDKNTKNAIEAARILDEKGVSFYIEWYGDMSNKEYVVECQQLINTYSLTDVFSLKEPTTNILQKYQSCNVFCLPSKREGCPNVIIEAMSCGKPILCSNICDNPIIVKNGINGFLFNPEDSEDIANAIIRFDALSDFEKEQFGKESRRMSIENYSPEVFTNKYNQLIEH